MFEREELDRVPVQNENSVWTNAVHPWNFCFARKVAFFFFFFFGKNRSGEKSCEKDVFCELAESTSSFLHDGIKLC